MGTNNKDFESKFEKNASFASIFQDKVLLLDMTLFDMDVAGKFELFYANSKNPTLLLW